MLLTIDVGNTNIVLAIFDGNTLKAKWRLSSDARRTADEYAQSIKGLMDMSGLAFSDITDTIIASVVPQGLFAITSCCKTYFHSTPMLVGDPSTHVNIQVCIDRPSELGADRLVNAVAGFQKFGGSLIIIDFGTATTFDITNAQGDYIGGVICPGIHLSMKALQQAAAKLPDIAITAPDSVIGTSTITAMQSGVYFGYLGMIEGITKRIITSYGAPMKVIATGGLASLFSDATSVIHHVEPDLTIWGLHHIFQHNKS